MKFLQAMLILSVMLPTQSCERAGPREQPAIVVTTSKKNLWFTIQNASCRNITIDGMPCIYCESYVRGGNAPALTCDWLQKNP